MPDTPERPPSQIQPVSATARIINDSPPPQYPIDPVVANNLAWLAWLMRNGLKIGGAVGSVLLLIVGWLLTVFVDMRSKINSMDDKIKAEVVTRSDDLRKELSAEAKQHAEELDLLKSTIEVEQSMTEMVCLGSHDEALTLYTLYADRIKPKDVPESMKPGLYRALLNAVLNSRKLHYLKDDDLVKIEAVIRKDTSSCGALYLGNLARIYAARGNFDKSRALILASIDTFLNARSGVAQPDQLAYSYATLIDVELAQHKTLGAKERALKAWESLLLVERRFVVSTVLILKRFADPSGSVTRKEQALAAGGLAYLEACVEIEALLESRDFEVAYIDVEVRAADGQIVTAKKAEVVVVQKKEPKEKKDQKQQPPMKCCGG